MDIEITQNIIDYIIDNRSRFEMDIPKLGEKWNVESITTYSGVNCGNPVVELSNDNKDWMVLPKELLYQQLENMLEESLSNEITESWNKRLEEAAIEYCGGNKGSDARVRTGFIMGAKWQKEQDMQKFLHSEVAMFTRDEFDAEITKAKQKGIEIGKAEIMSKVKRCLDKVDTDSDDCYEQINDCYDNLCEMINSKHYENRDND